MKKTIAILLVLVIGMVGVWAATLSADLNLTTTVYEFSEMVISSDLAHTWATFDNTTTADVINTPSNLSATINPYITTNQSVGYLHTRSNVRTGYTVNILATRLTDDTKVIDYELYNDADLVYTTSATTPVYTIFVTKPAGTGMQYDNSEILVKLTTTGDNLSAGSYSATVTFSYTTN